MNLPDPFFSAGPLKYVAGTSGGEFAGPCPWCGGEDRFRCWPRHPGAEDRGGRFMCRGCGAQGDGIDFLRERHGLGYREACSRLGVQPEPMREHRGVRPREYWTAATLELPGEAWRAAARQFLHGLPPALEYGRARSLTLETVQTLCLRWNAVDVYEGREAWGLPAELNPKTGKPRRVWLPAGLIIPNRRNGRGIGLKIRRRDYRESDGLPKYIAVSGSAMGSFIPPGAHPGLPVVAVESELDAALIWQEAGDLCAPMALGTARGKPDADAAPLLKAAPVILVALDFDRAGAEAWPWWRRHFVQACRWPAPCGKDPGEAMLAGLDLRIWIEAGLPFQGRLETPKSGRNNYPTLEPETIPGADRTRPKAQQARHRRITPTMRDNFRAGCAWLLPKLDELLAAEWTSKKLFAVGRLTFPWGWGIAWTSSWTDPARTPTLQPEGTIRWEIREAVRTVYQVSRPRPSRRAS